MLQSKAGTWIAGACAVVVLISIGYGMGRRASADLRSASQSLTPAGAPLPAIQIEPIQPQEELAAINASPTGTTGTSRQPSVADSALAAIPAPSTTAAALSTPTLEGSARIREVQKALKLAGYDPGPLDGQMGQKTRVAVRDFQAAHGLDPDGKVGPKTWSQLEPYLAKATTTASND